MKRLLDFTVSFIALTILLPLLLVTSFAIKLDSKGPIIFSQKRVGLGGREFRIYKFRSMINNPEGKGPYSTSVNDPRVTRLGRFLRKSSIDELPQLLNVIKGDMSIVGPRPNVFEQQADYTEDEWSLRNSVQPGITGLAQSTLRSAATPEERTKLDLEYIEKSSCIFDFWIIFLTVKQLIFRGSH